MGKSFIKEFLETYDETFLPPEINDNYNIISCFAQNIISTTYLIEAKADKSLYVMKCNNILDSNKVSDELALVKDVHHSGIPRYITEIKTDDTIYIIREYIEGVSLAEFLEEHSITKSQAIDIANQLCDILSFLHTQNPPIIHRDIKPSNIIIDPDSWKITLIDFDISRKYSESSKKDTVFFGTENFAPPEQYGFSQTDCRADIYSLGVLLNYMLTGTIDKVGQIDDKYINKIIKKCTEFAPKDRFQDVATLKKFLLITQGDIKKKLLKRIVAFSVSIVIFVLGMVVGRYTDFLQIHSDEVEFKEPLIKNAVCAVLGKKTSDFVTYEELKSISELFIMGNLTISYMNEWQQSMGTVFNTTNPYGNITSLEDLKNMPNLRGIYIFAQPIADITPLIELKNLETINFMHCNIYDISILSELKNLKQVSFFDNLIEDFSVLSKIKHLNYLAIGYMPIDSIDELGDIPNVKSLDFHMSTLKSLNGIEKFKYINYINLSGTLVTDFSALNSIYTLSEISISPDMEKYLNTLSREDVKIVIKE